jgi:hypothetical protein
VVFYLEKKFVNIPTIELNLSLASNLDLIFALYLRKSEANAAKSIKTNRNKAISQMATANMNSGYKF